MPEPTETDKDIPSLLPLAPGGVYSNKWEERLKWKEPIEVDKVDYKPPYEVNPSNPRCYLVCVLDYAGLLASIRMEGSMVQAH